MRAESSTANAHPNTAEPIAIVGMGCRFPGVSDVESFWNVLTEGRETVTDYPGGRFPYIDEVYAAGSEFASRIASRRGGFLSALDQFDAEFFGISPREAALLDPQQRLLLEVAWEAVDDAGLVREKLAGSRTGVFVGMWTNDYEDCLYESSPNVDFHATTGSGRYGASGRLAYFLDLRGPNLTLDTACSSSLVAIHLACQSLRTGESGIALAGGVNAILRPEITLVYSDAGMLAPDGRCKFGDASADGYVRSEGAGLLVLKRLSQAIADGDSIYAVIRGSAVNNDGLSSGLLVSPSRRGQEDVIRTALEYAGVDTDEVAYVEAHGTGTLAGDPVEIETIGRVMTSATRTHPCGVGSIKTNIGHTESAAGVAGVMKVALALDRGIMPPSLHFNEPSPRIPWSELPVTVPSVAMQWPNNGRMPVAGVSGFGITGTNAHAVLQRFERVAPSVALRSDRPFLFLLSAQTSDALRAVASSWVTRLEHDPEWPSSLADLAYTAAVRHTHHDYRLSITASGRAELAERLGAWLNGEELPGIISDRRLQLASNKAVFVYPGQGGQWLGMGRSLFEREPVFRDALTRCDAAIAKHAGWSVIDELRAAPENSRLDEIDVVQPTLFAVMIALTELWKSLGVEPSAVVGHSMGEVAAAAVAGALSLDDAAAVICNRSRLMKRLRGRGAMAVVELGLDDTRALLNGTENVWVGASNSASSTVISGDVEAVESVMAALESREVFCRRIKVDVASHSGHMDAVRDELESAVSHITPRAGVLPMYSTTTGEIEDGSRLDANYWGRNLRQPVLFHQAVERLLADGFDAFIEINAHPVLTHSLSDSVEQSGKDAVVTGSLRRDADEQIEILSATGKLHAAGYSVNFARMYPEGVSLRLPVYPWQRERHWFEPSEQQLASARSRIATAASFGAAEHVDVADSVNEIVWTSAPTAPIGQGVERERSHWIIFGNGSVSDGLVAQFSALGDTCTVIRPGTAFRSLDENTFEIDPASDDEMLRVLADRVSGCRGVIHAWSESSHRDVHDIDELWAAQSHGSLSVACLVRTLSKIAPSSVRLWLITTGIQRESGAAGQMPFPLHGAVAGLGRAIAEEHPEFQCRNLDLSVAPEVEELRAAALLMCEDVAEQQLVLRGARRLVARYRRTEPAAAPVIHSDATYLITGGLGGIGRLVARWLVTRGARSLVLTGRNAPSVEAATAIAEIEALGATVRVVRADVAEPSDVARLIADIRSDSRPLRGVLHLAATVDDKLLVDANDDSYCKLMRPKMAGAWNLYSEIGRDLDFWISFSSIAAVVSQPGQGPYAAANAFLDGFARYVSASGGRMQSLQSGPWEGTGLASEAGTQRSFQAYAAQGIRPMTQATGIAILDYAITQSASVALCASVDWRSLLAASSDRASANEFRDLAPDSKSEIRQVAESNLRDELAMLSPGQERTALLENHLREQLAAVLKIAPQRIDLRKPMGSMGVDSLMALELVRRLSKSIGIKVPATTVFNYPTIVKLAAQLQSRMSPVENKPVRIATDVPSTVSDISTSDVHAMSDDDALRALLGEHGITR
jgi:acyl transferase domain-containing protein/acyl carrier protein